MNTHKQWNRYDAAVNEYAYPLQRESKDVVGSYGQAWGVNTMDAVESYVAKRSEGCPSYKYKAWRVGAQRHKQKTVIVYIRPGEKGQGPQS